MAAIAEVTLLLRDPCKALEKEFGRKNQHVLASVANPHWTRYG